MTLARYIRLPLFEQITGYTQKAVRRKIEEGIWIQGRHYHRAPDGHILIDMEAYARWVEGRSTEGSDQRETGSKSDSRGAEGRFDRRSRSSQLTPT